MIFQSFPIQTILYFYDSKISGLNHPLRISDMTQEKTLMFSSRSLKRPLQTSACCIHNKQEDFPKSLERAGVPEHSAGDLTKRVDPGQENSAFFKQGSFMMLLSRPPTACGACAHPGVHGQGQDTDRERGVNHQTVPEVEEEDGANGCQSRDQAANVGYDTQVIPVHRGDLWRGYLRRRRNERW